MCVIDASIVILQLFTARDRRLFMNSSLSTINSRTRFADVMIETSQGDASRLVRVKIVFRRLMRTNSEDRHLNRK